jgi:hypothetical protein
LEDGGMRRNRGAAHILHMPLCVVLLLAIYLNSLAVAGENRMHEESRLRLASEIESVLIEEGACKSKRECQEKQLLFVSPAKNGISVKTYSISNPGLLMKITDKCMKVFYFGNNISIYIENFSISKSEELKRLFKSESPFNSIEFKRGA